MLKGECLILISYVISCIKLEKSSVLEILSTFEFQSILHKINYYLSFNVKEEGKLQHRMAKILYDACG